MSIYRGDGGAGNADDDATVNAVAANAVAAASSAAEAAVSASDAAISASVATTKANEAAVSASAISSASASAAAAAISETNAAASASSAATSATNAASIVGSGNGVFTVPVSIANNLSYTGTLTGGTGVVNIGLGQVYKDASGNIAIGSGSANGRLEVISGTSPTAAHMVIGYLGTSYNYFDGNTHSFRNGAYAEQLRVASTASAVNYVQATGSPTSGTVLISAQGSDASIPMQIRSKGTFNVSFANGAGNNGLVVDMTSGATLANYVTVSPKVAGSSPVVAASGTDTNIDLTFTPKGSGRVNITTSIAPKVSSTTSVASPLAWNSTSFDTYALTALANALTISADANTSPADGQKMVFRFKDNGTARTLTWTTGATRAFRAIGVVLPTTTVISKLLYVGCVYNAADSRWDVIAVGQEA